MYFLFLFDACGLGLDFGDSHGFLLLGEFGPFEGLLVADFLVEDFAVEDFLELPDFFGLPVSLLLLSLKLLEDLHLGLLDLFFLLSEVLLTLDLLGQVDQVESILFFLQVFHSLDLVAFVL